MKYFNVKSNGFDDTVTIELNQYANNNTLALCLFTDEGEPYCDLTVNIFESDIYASENTAFIDTNNCPWAEKFITDNELGEYCGYNGRSGFCEYPLYRFDMKKLKEVSGI